MSEIAMPCWIPRYEADPRYDYRAETFVDDAPGLAPGCGHEACLTELALHETSTAERENCTAQTMWDCPITECRWDTLHAMCDLDKGHSGEHVFVSADEITLFFPDTAGAEAAGVLG